MAVDRTKPVDLSMSVCAMCMGLQLLAIFVFTRLTADLVVLIHYQRLQVSCEILHLFLIIFVFPFFLSSRFSPIFFDPFRNYVHYFEGKLHIIYHASKKKRSVLAYVP